MGRRRCGAPLRHVHEPADNDSVSAPRLDGKPLTAAAVLFTPAGPGRTSIGITDGTGHYSLNYLRDIKGEDLGRHTVRITTATDDNGGKERLPHRYHAKSQLTASVAPGSNHYDFPLTSQP